jgi:hypothetical protein
MPAKLAGETRTARARKNKPMRARAVQTPESVQKNLFAFLPRSQSRNTEMTFTYWHGFEGIGILAFEKVRPDVHVLSLISMLAPNRTRNAHLRYLFQRLRHRHAGFLRKSPRVEAYVIGAKKYKLIATGWS